MGSEWLRLRRDGRGGEGLVMMGGDGWEERFVEG